MGPPPPPQSINSTDVPGALSFYSQLLLSPHLYLVARSVNRNTHVDVFVKARVKLSQNALVARDEPLQLGKIRCKQTVHGPVIVTHESGKSPENGFFIFQINQQERRDLRHALEVKYK